MADRDAATGQVALYLVREGKPRDEVSLIAGDAAHNLRSALDHFAYQWVLRKGAGIHPKWVRQIAFPIYARRVARKVVQKGASLTLAGYDDNVVRLLPGITRGSTVEAVFERLQPYHRTYRPLWHIHELDNLDKHRLLQVTSSRIANRGLGINEMWGFDMNPLNVYATATMKKRAKIADFTLVRTAPDARLQMNPQPTIAVVFGKGSAVSRTVAGKDVLATLEAARDLLREDVFPKLEALLR